MIEAELKLPIERYTLIFSGVAALVCAFLTHRAVTLGIIVGGGLAASNFFILRQLLVSLMAGGKRPRQLILVLALGLKFMGLIGLIWVATTYLPIQPIALALGYSMLVISIFFVGFRKTINRAASQTE